MNIESKNQKVLNHLLKGNKISTWTAIKLYRHTRLARAIYDFKNRGYNISDEWVEHAGSKYKVYFISPEN